MIQVVQDCLKASCDVTRRRTTTTTNEYFFRCSSFICGNTSKNSLHLQTHSHTQFFQSSNSFLAIMKSSSLRNKTNEDDGVSSTNRLDEPSTSVQDHSTTSSRSTTTASSIEKEGAPDIPQGADYIGARSSASSAAVASTTGSSLRATDMDLSHNDDDEQLSSFPNQQHHRSAHQRNVSWGQEEIFPTEKYIPPPATTSSTSTTSYHHHHLGTTQDRVAPDAASVRHRARGLSDTSEITADDHSLQRRRGRGGTGSNMSISLDDVRKQIPRESEAETYIIRALEEREEAGILEPTSIVNNVSEMVSEALAAVMNRNENASVDGASSMESPANDRESSSSMDHRTISTSRRSLNTAGTPGSPRSRKRLNSTASSSSRHIRSLTMEERLYDLTSAFDALHTEGDYLSQGGTTREYTMPMSSTDAFQQGTSILYHRTVTEKEDNRQYAVPSERQSEEGSVGDQSDNRSQTQKLHPKKNDDADEHLEGIREDSEDNYRDEENQNYPMPHRGKKKKSEIMIFREIKDFLGPQRKAIFLFFRTLLLYLIFPGISIAVILFYAAGNPPTGKLTKDAQLVNGTYTNTGGKVIDSDSASASWWFLFVVRQAVTATLAKAIEFIVIEFFAIRSRGAACLLGPWATLIVLQSRGWPFLLIAWSLVDFLLLSGIGKIGNHWLFWQDSLDVFNESNPSGSFVDSTMNNRILGIALCMGIIVTIKRFALGLYLGKQTFLEFSGRLESAMKKILLISQVSRLAQKIERINSVQRKAGIERGVPVALLVDDNRLKDMLNSLPDETSVGGTSVSKSDNPTYNADHVIDPTDRHPLTGKLSSVQKSKITQLLGAWEEPRSLRKKQSEHVSINALLQFRRALACLKTEFPFGPVFGPADTREDCVESSQEVYRKLVSRSDDTILNFDLLAVLALYPDESLDQEKAQDLIRLFRPERDGSLDVISFVKSIDMVYKEIRMLRASVDNATKIDRAFENILNVIFYAIATTVILSRLGFDPLALFLSISGVVLGFAFMISSASSKYFEGLLFVLVRRPFQIGDAIHVSNVDSDTSFSGSAWWIVEDVSLFTTEVVFLYTMERASLSNGSLANSRIINSTRSTDPYLWFLLKFPVDVTFDKLQIFHRAVVQFIFNRPREWITYADFRATNVETDKGYIEYLVGSQFRSNWSDWSTIKLGLADLVLFCTELQKKLGIVFRPPSLPVDLSIKSSLSAASPFNLETIQESEPSDAPAGLVLNETLLSDIKGLDNLFPYRTKET